MLDHPRTDRTRRTGDDVEHAFGEAGFDRDLAEFDRGQRRRRRRLEDDGAACSERGSNLPRCEQQRKVPGNDGADYADGLAERIGHVGGNRRRQRLAVVFCRRARVELEAIHDRADFAIGRRYRLAVVAHLEERDLRRALGDQRGHLINDFCAPRCRRRGPASVEGAAGSGYSGVDVVARCVGDVGDLLAGCRIEVGIHRCRPMHPAIDCRSGVCRAAVVVVRHVAAFNSARSNTVAIPWPTPMHIVASAYRPLRRRSSCKQRRHDTGAAARRADDRARSRRR